MKKHKKSKKLKFTKKEIIRRVAIVAAVIVVISVLLVLLEKWEGKRTDNITAPKSYLTKDTVEYDGVEYERKSNLETLLVMGLDKNTFTNTGESYNSEYQSDFMMLLVFNHKDKTYSALHINRDMMADMEKPHADGKGSVIINRQIALAYSYEDGDYKSCLNATDALENVFDNALGEVEIDEYMSVTMDAVKIINDSVGGVEVEIKDDFSGIDDTLIQGETITLNGDQALVYVRERYGMEDSTNIARMDRQQQYLEALRAQGVEAVESDDDFILNTLDSIDDMLISSYNLASLANTVECIVDYEFKGFREIEGTSEVVDGHVQFTPSNTSLQELVLDLFYSPVEEN